MTGFVTAVLVAVLGTVPATSSRVEYIATGSSASFTFNFKATSTAHVEVFLDGVRQSTGWGVGLNADQSAAPGGTVTFQATPAAGKVVRIQRTVPLGQPTPWADYDKFRAKTLESALDAQAMQVQQIDRHASDTDAAVTTETAARVSNDSSIYDYVSGLSAGNLLIVPKSWTFTANGLAVTFPLSGADVGGSLSYAVSIDGVAQSPTTDFSILGTSHDLTFTSAPPLGATIDVRALAYAKALGQGDSTMVQATGSSTARTLANWMADTTNVLALGADPTGATDSSSAFVAAFAKGKNVFVPTGVYSISPTVIPLAMRGHAIFGDGFWHYGATASTVIKAYTPGQANIFSLANGADNVTIRDLRLDGNGYAQKGIDGTYGAFLTLEEVGVYNCTTFGAYLKQGLARIRRVFFENDAVGLQVYSDSTVTDSEFTGGTVPLLIVAGGNRLSSVWANSGTAAQVRLVPFDSGTTLINTSIVNLYAGETYGGSGNVVPVIDIAGTSAQKVQKVMITGSYFVNRVQDTAHANGFIRIANAIDITLAGNVFDGQDTYASSNYYTAYAVSAPGTAGATVDGLTLSSNTLRGINLNAISLALTTGLSITGNTFTNCGSTYAAGSQGANIILLDSTTRGAVTGNHFNVQNASTVPYAIDGPNATLVAFTSNFINYPNATIANFAAGTFTGTYQAASGNLTYGAISSVGAISTTGTVAGARNASTQNYQTQGTFAGAGSTTQTVYTVPNVAQDQSYLLIVQQQGSGANATFGIVTARSATLGVATIGNANATGALQNTFSISGSNIQMTVGSGYGATTWLYTLLRIG